MARLFQKVVVLVIPAAKQVPTAFNGVRYLRLVLVK